MKKVDSSKHFLTSKDISTRRLFYKVIDLGFDFINGKERQNKVLVYKKPEFFKKMFSERLPKDGVGNRDMIHLLKGIGKYSISQSDLNYLAFPDSGNSVAGLLAEIYSKFLNQNLIAFDRSAPIATFIEIQLIEWLRELVGYKSKKIEDMYSLSEVSGMWTTGGHMSNHIAILTALNWKFGSIKSEGLTSLSFAPKIVLANKISHYSMSSAMHHLGLGNKNIISVESNEDFTTNTQVLEKILFEHKNIGDIFMVIGVAGNTRTSSIDNIEEIARICREYGVWFHVDACHGGSLLYSDRLKQQLKGIEEADSVSLDPHKGMFVTYPSSYVIFKKRDALVRFTRYEEQVRSGGVWDLGYITPFFGSRGFESLKLWFLIKILGKSSIAKIVEKRDRDAKYAAGLLRSSKYFTLFHDMTFYRLVFVYFPEEIKRIIEKYDLSSEILLRIKECIDFYTHKINQELYEEGHLCIDEFKLHDISNSTKLNADESRFCVMSITIGNPLYTKKSLVKSLNYLFQKAEKYLPKFKNDLQKILKLQQYKVEEIKNYGPAGWE